MTDRDEEMVAWVEKFFALKEEIAELRRLNDSTKIDPSEVDRRFASISERMKAHYEHGREVFKGIRRIEELIEQGEEKRQEILGRFAAHTLGRAGMKLPGERSD